MKYAGRLAAILVLSAAAFAQQPSRTPTENDGDVVKITTNLIQIDVTVIDKKGNIVRDLKPDEIEIYENGKRQKVTNFTFISSAIETETAGPEEKRTAAVLPPAPIRLEQVRRTIALVVDDLSLSFSSVYYTRQALRKFVDEQMREGDLVAIIRTGAGIGALQQFTNDRRQLHAAIERVRWNSRGVGRIGAFAPIEARPIEPARPPGSESTERSVEDLRNAQESFRESVFAAGTLGAINYVVRGMRELPGRKSVMLISDGFRLYEEDSTGFRDHGRVLAALRHLVDQANRAAVVINTLDARGLAFTGLTAADDTGGRSAEQVEQMLSDRRDQLFDTQDGLRFLARQTGGQSIQNTNDLSGGVRRMLDDQSYYLIAYDPGDDTFDPRVRKFNKLDVKVSRPDTRVRYRSGFFGVVDVDRRSAPEPPMTNTRRLFLAMTSPFGVGQIGMRLNALFGSGPSREPFIRSLVHISARDLKFEDLPDGKKKAVFDIAAIAFGDNGSIVEQLNNSYALTVKPDDIERFQKEGFVYNFVFPMKKPGAYQLRVAVLDRGNNNVGAANQFIEVPDLKKDRLTLSGIVLENTTYDEYKRRGAGQQTARTTTLSDTSLRQFRSGTVLNYGYTVFNVKPDSVASGSLISQLRLYRDGKMIFEGKAAPLPPGEPGPAGFSASASLMLGTELGPGDYVLQIAVTDKLAKRKYQTVEQFVQFEIIE